MTAQSDFQMALELAGSLSATCVSERMTHGSCLDRRVANASRVPIALPLRAISEFIEPSWRPDMKSFAIGGRDQSARIVDVIPRMADAHFREPGRTAVFSTQGDISEAFPVILTSFARQGGASNVAIGL